MLVCENLSLRRAGTSFKFNLSLAGGQGLAIMGPSGAGKSTLLDLIAGFEQPDQGHLSFKGQSLLHLKPGARPIALLTQSDNLFPHLSLFDNLGLALTAGGKLSAENKQEIQTVLEKFELAELGQRLPAQVSGGQTQRAALARALLQRKSLLLLDEPFSALDAHLRQHLANLIKGLQLVQDLTVIMVTHDEQEANWLGYPIAMLQEGKLSYPLLKASTNP